MEDRAKALSTRHISDVALFFAHLCPFFAMMYGDGSHGEFGNGALLEQFAKAFECTKEDIISSLPSPKTLSVSSGALKLFALVAQLGGVYTAGCVSLRSDRFPTNPFNLHQRTPHSSPLSGPCSPMPRSPTI